MKEYGLTCEHCGYVVWVEMVFDESAGYGLKVSHRGFDLHTQYLFDGWTALDETVSLMRNLGPAMSAYPGIKACAPTWGNNWEVIRSAYSKILGEIPV